MGKQDTQTDAVRDVVETGLTDWTVAGADHGAIVIEHAGHHAIVDATEPEEVMRAIGYRLKYIGSGDPLRLLYEPEGDR